MNCAMARFAFSGGIEPGFFVSMSGSRALMPAATSRSAGGVFSISIQSTQIYTQVLPGRLASLVDILPT